MMDRDSQINERLAAFEKDTTGFMNEQLEKKTVDGHTREAVTPFAPDDDFIEARDVQRQITLGNEARSTRAAIGRNDDAANLVDNLRYNTLQAMEDNNLKSAKLAETPWSDDYWAIYKGVLGARYADPDFPSSKDWKKMADYILDNPAADILESRSATRINRLSPAEKYDALIGDENGSLTQALWMEGKRYYDDGGKVETWMGICHGWAPAAYMLERPAKPVTLLSPDNIPIKFYPSDIKSLASLLWANVAPGIRFIGGRCNDKDPARDEETGRVISEKCFDTNPGTWHLSVVNQIGVAKRSFVLDITFDYEVWNQPVYRYEYTYFNPQTRTASNDLEASTVRMEDYSNDKFKRFRGAQARYVVGVSMEVFYMVETRPRQLEEDKSEYDAIRSVTYEYDLELDEDKKIIGGEWYRNRHPDFLWTPSAQARAETRFESSASGDWQNAKRSMPQSWRIAAAQASAEQRAPLAKIVEQMIEFSNAGQAQGGGSEPGEENPGSNGNENENGGGGQPGGSNTNEQPDNWLDRLRNWFRNLFS